MKPISNKRGVERLTNWVKRYGSGKRAAIVSGPTGVGKHVAIRHVAKQLGYDTWFSDTKEDVLRTTGIGVRRTAPTITIISEAEHGSQEGVIRLIKSAREPLILVCNDRYAQSLKSIVAYCEDIRFHYPGRSDVIDHFVNQGYNRNRVLQLYAPSRGYDNDIRHMYMNLSMPLSQGHSEPVNIFEATKTLLTWNICNIDQGLHIYEYDAFMMPLMIHENYLSSGEHPLDRYARAADSISLADTMVGRGTVQGITSTIIPCAYVRSQNWSKNVKFSQHLGKMSKIGKKRRKIEQVHHATAFWRSMRDFVTFEMPLSKQIKP